MRFVACTGPEIFIVPALLLGAIVACVTVAIIVGSVALRRRERCNRYQLGECQRCGNPLWGMATCWMEPVGFEVIQ